jgi:thiol-disulfide isomerase/thioredoxin
MDLGRWVLLLAVAGALLFGGWRAISDGRFRGTHRVREGSRLRSTAEETRSTAEETRSTAEETGATAEETGATAGALSVLDGTAYDGRRGERATLLQFSSAFCAPCRATRRVLADVSSTVPGVVHVEVDAEEHLDLVRRLGVARTPTTLVLDASGREVTRASGAPRTAQVLAALEQTV